MLLDAAFGQAGQPCGLALDGVTIEYVDVGVESVLDLHETSATAMHAVITKGIERNDVMV